eukprot:3195624-Rhodomonas_salina.2
MTPVTPPSSSTVATWLAPYKERHSITASSVSWAASVGTAGTSLTIENSGEERSSICNDLSNRCSCRASEGEGREQVEGWGKEGLGGSAGGEGRRASA